MSPAMSDRPKPPEPIRRWDCTERWDDQAICQEDPNGAWVLYDDHIAALQSRDRRIAELESRLPAP